MNLGLTVFYCVVLGFTGFCQVLQDYTEFYRVLSSFTELYRFLPSSTMFYRVLLSFPWFGQVLPSFTEFHQSVACVNLGFFLWCHRVLPGFYRVSARRTGRSENPVKPVNNSTLNDAGHAGVAAPSRSRPAAKFRASLATGASAGQHVAARSFLSTSLPSFTEFFVSKSFLRSSFLPLPLLPSVAPTASGLPLRS